MIVSNKGGSRSAPDSLTLAVRKALQCSGTTLLMLSASLVAGQASAQETATPTGGSASDPLEQVTVTGTRIVRDGYEAPTPVTVISVDEIQKAPQQHISDFVNRLPAFGGGMSTTSGGNEISGGRQSQNNLNLRSLESYRTLVLLDGQRIVSGDVNGSVNINDLPQSLIRSVDVVTGGASAAYGSDALAGVVNFVLDKDYTGFKTDFQGGITDHGDNESYKANVTFGTPFADGRGHFIASAEYAHNNGLFGSSANRDWGFDTAHIITNPAYNANTNNTVPQFLIRRQASQMLVTPGGIINDTRAGRQSLRGTAFNQDGSSYQYQYGSLNNSQYTVGGDWRDSEVTATAQSLANKLERGNAFARLSFDINDNVTAFVNLIYSNSEGVARSKQDDQGSMTIKASNPFLPADLAARVAAAGVPDFIMGSYNRDLDYIYTDNRRNMFSYAVGLEGTFQAFGKDWNWEAFGQVGKATTHIDALVKNNRNFNLALDAVSDVNGNIVCAVNADAVTTNDAPGCVAWNPFGWNQNGADAVAWSKGHSRLDQENKQTVGTVGVSGEPFDNWAGPVSIATGLEWRKEEVVGVPDALSLQSVYSAGNFKGIRGDYDVSEAYFETVVPLVKDVPLIRSLEFNGAARYTDYSTSGDVTTWKAGLTYDVTDELRFRFTRSRDIRAPNLGELYARGQGGQSIGNVDPATGLTLPTFLNNTVGNPDLTPEKADTTGIGVVYRPAFLDGFSMAVDYYDIDVNDAILTVGTQETLDRCQAGQQFYCDNISRGGPNGQIDFVTSLPFNFANLNQRGVDIETSYMTSLGALVSSWKGDLTLRALGTHVIRSKRDDGFNPVQDFAGDNSDVGPLNWRWLFTTEYSLDAFTVSWTGRFMSAGEYAARYVECTENCARSTAFAQTIDYNYIASRFYHDLSFSYELAIAGTESQLYLNVANVLDEQPPLIASANPSLMSTNPQLYDTIGRSYFAGVRFKF
jgi:outer membrane receptor protein involved in Fe transport